MYKEDLYKLKWWTFVNIKWCKTLYKRGKAKVQ